MEWGKGEILSVATLSSSCALYLGTSTSYLIYLEHLARLFTILIKQLLTAACYSVFGYLDKLCFVLYPFLIDRHLSCFWMSLYFWNMYMLRSHCSSPQGFAEPLLGAAAAAAKSLQSFPTLCNPTDDSPPGSLVPGILQARTLECVAISFSNAWKRKVKVKSFSHVWLFETPQPTRLLRPWEFLGERTGVGCYFLLLLGARHKKQPLLSRQRWPLTNRTVLLYPEADEDNQGKHMVTFFFFVFHFN